MEHRRAFRSLCLAGVWMAVLASCGNDGDGGPSDGSTPVEPDAPVCAAPGDSFSVGISKTSTAGMRVAIEDANPAPPGIGKNAWRINVKDGAGNPIAGATVNFSLYMPPPHGHDMAGTVGKDMGDGIYTAAELNFTMAGLVYITVQVTPPVGPMDKVMFPFCVKREGN